MYPVYSLEILGICLVYYKNTTSIKIVNKNNRWIEIVEN